MEMDKRLFYLTFALVICKSASQTLTVTTPCIEAGKAVILNCETTNFLSSVNFYLEAVNNRGGCVFTSCTTLITGYEQPIQSGTSTQMTITAYNDARDGGVWTCSYGTARSPNVTVELGNCEATTEGSTEGNSSPQNGIEGGAIAGIVLGCVVFAAIVITIIVVLRKQNKPYAAQKKVTCSHSINLLDSAAVDLTNVKTIEWKHELFGNEDLISERGKLSIIPCVAMEHSGKWTCTIQFKEPKPSKTISLYLTVNALSMEVASTYPVNLLEKIQSITNSASVKWTHKSYQVNDKDMYQNGNVNNPSLNIGCVSLEDSGMWQCQMEFERPYKTKTFVVHLQVKGKPMKATVSSKVKLLPELIDIHDIEIVEWKHNNVDHGKSLPPYTIASVSTNDYGKWLGKLYFKDKTKPVKTFSVELY